MNNTPQNLLRADVYKRQQREFAEQAKKKFGLKLSAANFLRELSLLKSGMEPGGAEEDLEKFREVSLGEAREELLKEVSGSPMEEARDDYPVSYTHLIMYRFFCSVPHALIEAARVDGAGELAIFLHIGLPMGSPGIISAMVLGYLEYWNLIEQPLTFLKNKELWPLSLYLPNISMDRACLLYTSRCV